MKRTGLLLVFSVIALLALPTLAVDVTGQWRGEFESQIGQQSYLFTFQVNEGKVMAKATAEAQGQQREVTFKEAKLEGDTLTFVDMRTFQNNEVQIDYTGKVGANAIKFTRKVGDFATQQFVAKRAEAGIAAITSPNGAARERPRPGARGFGGPIVLGPDDKPAFDDPPADIATKRGSI